MTARTRLLWFIDSLNVGGAETLMVSFARGYDRERFEVVVACLKPVTGSTIEAQLLEAGVRIIPLNARNLRDVRAFRRLLAVLRDERIELVHAHLVDASIWAAVASRISGIPSVVTLHTSPQPERFRQIRERLMRVLIDRWATLVIVVSDALGQDYLHRGGLRAAKIRTAHNGVVLTRFERPRDQARAELAREFSVPEDVPLLVSVSVFREPKGIDVLLRAMASSEVADGHLVIFGDGEMRESWMTLAGSLGLDGRVHWAGYRSDVERFLAGCDVFVHPTFEDAFPTVLLEAMAAGLPVIASSVGGIPEIVNPELTGRLVPPRNEEALAAAIVELLGDGQLRLHLGEAGRRVALEKFSTAAWIARLEKIYEEALSS